MEKKFNTNDIVVCKSGFTNIGGSDGGSGGSGYLDGSISKLKDLNYHARYATFDKSDRIDDFVYWSDDFPNKCGVYHRALRKATPLEIKAYNSGIRNIGNIISNIEKKAYIISYETTNNKTKKNTIKATSKEDAISKLKNLKNVNYIIG